MQLRARSSCFSSEIPVIFSTNSGEKWLSLSKPCKINMLMLEYRHKNKSLRVKKGKQNENKRVIFSLNGYIIVWGQ